MRSEKGSGRAARRTRRRVARALHGLVHHAWARPNERGRVRRLVENLVPGTRGAFAGYGRECLDAIDRELPCAPVPR